MIEVKEKIDMDPERIINVCPIPPEMKVYIVDEFEPNMTGIKQDGSEHNYLRCNFLVVTNKGNTYFAPADPWEGIWDIEWLQRCSFYYLVDEYILTGKELHKKYPNCIGIGMIEGDEYDGPRRIK